MSYLTYKFDQSLEKIVSPVILVFPDGSHCKYENGKCLDALSFNEKYKLKTIQAKAGTIDPKFWLSSTNYGNC